MNHGTRISMTAFAGVLILVLFVGIASEAQDRAPSVPLPPSPPSESFVKRIVLGRFPGIDQDAVMTFMQKHLALELSEFRKLVVWKPDDATDVLTDLVQESLDLIDMEHRDPDLFALMLQQKNLQRRAEREAQTARSLKGKEKGEQAEKLKTTVDTAFEVRQELLQRDVEHMQAQLEKLRGLTQKRNENRTAIVARRVSELMGDGSNLDW